MPYDLLFVRRDFVSVLRTHLHSAKAMKWLKYQSLGQMGKNYLILSMFSYITIQRGVLSDIGGFCSRLEKGAPQGREASSRQRCALSFTLLYTLTG